MAGINVKTFTEPSTRKWMDVISGAGGPGQTGPNPTIQPYKPPPPGNPRTPPNPDFRIPFNPQGEIGNQSPDLIRELLDDERRRAMQKQELDILRQRRNEDIASGQDYIKDFALQRLNLAPSVDNENLLQMLRNRAQGLTGPEGSALRDQAYIGLDRQRQGDLRALRGIQGQQGIRGPAAGAQQQNIMREAADRGRDLEQKLLLDNINIQRQGAQDLQSEMARQQNQDLSVKQFNTRIANQEANLKQAFPFLFAGLGAEEAGTAAGVQSSRDQLMSSIFRDQLPQVAGTEIDQPEASKAKDWNQRVKEFIFNPVSAIDPFSAAVTPQGQKAGEWAVERLGI